MKQSWHHHRKVAPAAERTSSEGILFHSKTELQRWEYLKLLLRAGEIHSLERQVRCVLRWDGKDKFTIMAGDVPAIYTVDFVYCEKGSDEKIYEDVKGYRDEQSKFRIRVFEALYGVKVRIVKKQSGGRNIGGRWVTE